MKSVNLFRKTLVLLSMAGLASVQAAGSMSGQLNSQMTLQSSCIISGAPNAGTSGVNFGTLNFGTHPSTFTGEILATASGGVGGAGSTQISCSPDITSLSVSVSGGNNAGQGSTIGNGTRAMKLGSTSSFIPYEIYSDSAMTTPYPANASSISVTLLGNGSPYSSFC